jgi:hypothetical protein
LPAIRFFASCRSFLNSTLICTSRPERRPNAHGSRVYPAIGAINSSTSFEHKLRVNAIKPFRVCLGHKWPTRFSRLNPRRYRDRIGGPHFTVRASNLNRDERIGSGAERRSHLNHSAVIWPNWLPRVLWFRHVCPCCESLQFKPSESHSLDQLCAMFALHPVRCMFCWRRYYWFSLRDVD